MNGQEVQVNADFHTRPVTTAALPEAPQPNQHSTIGIAPAHIPGLGGNVLMLSIVDGEGRGAIAVLDRESIVPVMVMMHRLAIQNGIMPVPEMQILEN